MIVKEYKERWVPNDSPRWCYVKDYEQALMIDWLRFRGAKYVWENDEHGYGLVISFAGQVIAVILED